MDMGLRAHVLADDIAHKIPSPDFNATPMERDTDGWLNIQTVLDHAIMVR